MCMHDAFILKYEGIFAGAVTINNVENRDQGQNCFIYR